MLPLAFATYVRVRVVPSIAAVTISVLLLATLRTNVSDSMSENTLDRSIIVGDASSSTVTSDMALDTVGVSLIAFIVTEKVSETDNTGLVPVSVAVTTTVVFPFAFAT